MALGLIPRFLWPEKPPVGGGGDVVSHFTGMQFAENTSVGVGQVMEFYVNFGTEGVIIGFLCAGWIIGKLDLRAMECLNRGDQKGFLIWFLICLSMINPGGNLLEVVVTTASAAVTANGLCFILNRYFLQPSPEAV
jgi:hypothetical protein